MRGVIKTLSALLLGIAAPGAPAAADFDYYLLALTWSPSWCLTDAGPDDEQCDPDRDLGFTLHGLWPQYADGWPEYCDSPWPDPTRRQTAAMADVMGSGGLAWYQWKKHGRCSGLPPEAYFAAARLAFGTIAAPEPDGPAVTADALERAFIRANRGLDRDEIIVTCRDGRVQEVRICLDHDLEPRPCGPDVLRAACRDRGTIDVPPVP